MSNSLYDNRIVHQYNPNVMPRNRIVWHHNPIAMPATTKLLYDDRIMHRYNSNVMPRNGIVGQHNSIAKRYITSALLDRRTAIANIHIAPFAFKNEPEAISLIAAASANVGQSMDEADGLERLASFKVCRKA